MKKSLYVVGAAIFCFCSNSAVCETEETFTYGTPPSNTWGGLPSGTDIGAMNQRMIWEMQHAQSVEAGRSVYEQIKEQRKSECIKKAQTEFNEFVALSKVTLLDNSASNCQQRFPAQATIYWLNGNDNAYSQCIRADEQTFNSLVDGAKEVMNTKLKGC